MKLCLSQCRRAVVRAMVLSALLPSAACTAPTERSTSPPVEGVGLDQLVAGDAAAHLGRDGLFSLSSPVLGTLGVPEIDEPRARRLAEAFVRQHLDGLRAELTRRRGAPVDPAGSLTLCGRVYYAASPFASVPSQLPRIYWPIIGPWWLVQFCGNGGESQVLISVSAFADDIEIRDDGTLVYPRIYGAEFEAGVIRPGGDEAAPITPERAVEIAAGATGRRVVGIPTLVAPSPHYVPQMAHWRLQLDRPVNARRADNGEQTAVGEVFVSASRGQVHVLFPRGAQPVEFRLPWQALPQLGTRPNPQALPRPVFIAHIPRRPDVPIEFDTLTVREEQ